jgi:GNAT superfamily N-acetyltransferase
MPEHVPGLPKVERAAGTLFPAQDLPQALREETHDPEEFDAARRDRLLWVALEPTGAPVGFALGTRVDGLPHLLELAVHPEHGRRGVGRALVQAMLAQARADRHRGVTLTTFRHLAFNAPFYESVGFRVLTPSELTPGLAAILADEARRGLDPAKRVAMRRDLAD